MRYRPEIDGLRAFAVIFVVLFHTDMTLFAGGFIGVDIFFVITGYLMTLIINEGIDNKNFVLLNFYLRRMKRILPAYIFVIFLFIPISFIILVPTDFENFSESIVASALFLANVYYFRNHNYFDVNLQNQPFLHLWSIGVETQFYVMFPFFIYLINYITKIIRIKGFFLIAFVLINLIVLEFALVSEKSRFYLLVGRFWEFLLGAFVALYITSKGNKINRANSFLSFIGLILIIIPVFTLGNSMPLVSSTLAPVLGATLILAYANPKNFTGRILSSKIFVKIGLLSYSIFLFHYPVFVIARINSESDLSIFTYIWLTLLTLVVSYYSFSIIEKPFRKTLKISANSFLILFSSLISILLIAGFVGKISNGFEDFYLKNRLSDSQKRAYEIIQLNSSILTDRMYDDLDCKFSTILLDKEIVKRFDSCYTKYGKALIVIGDSHALNLYNIISQTNSPFIFSLASAGCRLGEDKNSCHYNEIIKFIKTSYNKINRVIYHQSGTYLIKDKFGGNNLNSILDSYPVFNLDNDKYLKLVSRLDEIGSSVDVIWLGSHPEPNIDLTNPKYFTLNLKIPKKNFSLVTQLDNKVNIKYSNFQFIPFNLFVNLPSNFMIGKECMIWSDGDHLSECGEIFAAKNIIKLLG
jgi:peptidoglycan/LPS O-acetylase OafA/YrhL